MFNFVCAAFAAIALSVCAVPAPAPAAPAPLVLAPAAPAAVKAPERLEALLAPVPAPLPPYALPAPAPTPVVNVAPAPAPVVNVSVPDTKADFAYGEWLVQLLTFLGGFWAVIRVLIASLIKNPMLRLAFETYFSDARVKELVGTGIARVEGAVKGKTLSVDVGNAVVAAALEAAPELLTAEAIRALGGEAAIRARIIAALDLEEAASAATVS